MQLVYVREDTQWTQDSMNRVLCTVFSVNW